MNCKKPNLFILGAPKCGTTSLAHYLNQHPNAGMCKYKEPCYFASEFKRSHKASNLAEYKSLYTDEVLSKDIVFEATTRYLMSSKAVDRILQFNSDAKFICMVRNPYEMIPSWHDQLLFNGLQNMNIDRALSKAEKLNKSLEKEEYSNSKMIYDYLYVASNGAHSARLLRKIKPEKLKFIIFDEFISNTHKVFKEICDFLGIKMASINFDKKNSRKYNRFPKFKNFVTFISKLVRRLGIKNTGISKKIIEKQIVENKKKREINFSSYAINVLNNDIDLLQNCTKKDLSEWKK